MIMKRISIAACLLLAACGDGQDSGEVTEPTSYPDMSFEQRYAFMNDVVLPQMKETFVAFDAKYKDMTCATCHGAGATDGSYAMPSEGVPRLPPEEEFIARFNEDPEFARWSQFMLDEVWPQMSDLLEMPVFDPEKNPTGFSCSNCHKIEGEP